MDLILPPMARVLLLTCCHVPPRKGEAVVAPPMLAQIDLEDGRIMRSIEVPWGSTSLVSVKNSTNIYVIGKDIVKVDVSGEEMKLIGTYPMFEKKMEYFAAVG